MRGGCRPSSSHALIGGFAGAAVAKAGFGALIAAGLVKIGVFIVLAPLIGFVARLRADARRRFWIFRHAAPGRVDRLFRAAAARVRRAYSLGHGTNDAQKTMGIIAVLLFATGHLGAGVLRAVLGDPRRHAAHRRWARSRAAGASSRPWACGSPSCARSAASARRRPAPLTLIGTALAGIPVSTTHTITGAIMGVGALQRFSAVRWGVAGRIVWAWVLTIPASALVAAATWLLLRLLGA